jgi:hypothetical protein
MTTPIPLPDWLPWWVPIVLLAPALLYALVFFFMPFSMLGVKGRLDAIEARLDEIQGEIRSLSLRMPELPATSHFDDLYAAPPPQPAAYRTEPALSRPPIPPAPREQDEGLPPKPLGPRPGVGRGTAPADRAEPRLNWPQ